MTIRQRNTLIGLSGLLLVVLVLLLVTRGGHNSKVLAGPAPGSSSTTADSAPPTTPVSLAPVTEPPSPDDSSATTAAAPPSSTAPPTTAPPATAPTTKPPATTTTTSPGQVVDGKGAVLVPHNGSTKPYGGDCHALLDQGWTFKDCGKADTGSATLVWIIETKSGGASQTFVYQAGPATADEVLEALDDDANSFADVKAVVADVAGDGHQEIAFGFHDQGSGGILAVDLVGGAGSVLVHRDYGSGSAKVTKGQLDGWGTDSPATGQYTHEVIQYRSSAWRITSSTTTSGPPPAGNL